MKRILLLLILNFALLGFVMGQTIRFVTPTGAGSKNGTSWGNAYDKNQLQTAINETSVTEVWVAAGTYYPTTGTDRTISFSLKNDVAVYGGFAGTETLLSERDWKTNVTILSGDIGTVGDNTDNSYHVISNSGIVNTAVLDGFTVLNGNANNGTFGGGIYNESSSPILVNLIITENSATYGGGIGNNTSFPTLKNCIITKNSATSYGGGIYSGSSNPILINCLLTSNTSSYGGGLFNDSASPTLSNCTISDNFATTYGGGFYSQGSSDPTLDNSIIWGNVASTGGNQIKDMGGTVTLNYSCYSNGIGDVEAVGTITPDANCVTTDPKFINPNNDFRLAEASPCLDSGSEAFNSEATDIRGAGYGRKLLKTDAATAGTIDMGAYEYKKGSDPESSELLRLYVKADATGTNNGSSWANAYNSLKDAITAAGRYYEIWVAAGTYYPTTGTDRTVSFNMKSDLTIYGGFAGTETLLSERDWKTNVTVLSGDIGTVGDNTDNSYHVISNSGIVNTSVLDGFTVQGGYDNVGYSGGGILNSSSSPQLRNLIIKDNYTGSYGGGMYNVSSSPLIVNVVVSNNTASYGGGIGNGSSSPELVNCLIVNNSVTNYGGGLHNESSSPVLTNCTISGNSSGYYGGGIYSVSSSAPTINNSIIWGNTATTSGQQIYINDGTVTLNYSCYGNSSGDVYNGGTLTPDANCVTIDPRFVNVSGNDFRILGSSPCKNTGNNAANATITDIRRQARIQNTTIDMGAYEWTTGIDPDGILTWTGAVSTDWNTASNWNPNSVPTTLSSVLIPNVTNKPVVNESQSAPAYCSEMTIEPGAMLTIAANKALVVSGNIANNNSAGVVGITIQSNAAGTGSLIAGSTSGTGTALAERYMTGNVWHLVSPIATGEAVSDFVGDTNNAIASKPSTTQNYGLAPYRENDNEWEYFKTTGVVGSFDVAAKGYEILRNSDGPVSFKGSLTSTDITKSIVKNNNGWNLIGNPYPCALDINSFLANSNNITAIDPSYLAIYVADLATDGYTAVNNTSDLKLAAGEGFFVKSATSSGNLDFTTAMKTAVSDLFKSAKIQSGIDLTAEIGTEKRITSVKYIQGSTTGLDPGWDAGLFNGNQSSFSLYTRLVQDNGVDFAIQSLPASSYNDLVIPVGLQAPKGSNVVFKATALGLPDNYSVYLEDKVAGKLTLLNHSGSFYSVKLESGSTGDGRFYLYTKQEVTGIDKEPLNSLKIIPVSALEKIRIEGYVDLPCRAKIYDMQGRLIVDVLLNQLTDNEIAFKNVSNGIYLVEVQSAKTTVRQKISWVR